MKRFWRWLWKWNGQGVRVNDWLTAEERAQIESMPFESWYRLALARKEHDSLLRDLVWAFILLVLLGTPYVWLVVHAHA